MRILLAAAGDNGRRFGHHCHRWTSPNSIKQEASINKLISTLIQGIYQIASTAALERTCAMPPTPQAAWVHQIHATGGASGSNTMVMLFVMMFVLFVRFLTCDSSVVLVVRTFQRCYKVSHPVSHHTADDGCHFGIHFRRRASESWKKQVAVVLN